MQFRPEIDYYEILQVHPRASPEIIKKAYRTLMGEMRAHPDLGGDVERAKLINEAYRVLGDEDLRRAYDRARDGRTVWGESGRASPAGGGSGDRSRRSAEPNPLDLIPRIRQRISRTAPLGPAFTAAKSR